MVKRPALLLFLFSLLVVATPGCEPEEAPSDRWQTLETPVPILDPGATDTCKLPDQATLEDHFADVAGVAIAGIAVSGSEPVRLTNENLATAVHIYLSNLYTLSLDAGGSVALSRGIPSAKPTTTEDYAEVWGQLRKARICGAATITYEFSAGPIETLAWIVDETTFFESVADYSIFPEIPSLEDRRTDQDCSIGGWSGSSYSRALGSADGTYFDAQFGICGEYVDEERTELECGEPSPRVESNILLGGFDCEEPVSEEMDACCATSLTCSFTMGFAGFGCSHTHTPVALACPGNGSEDESPPQECDESEW